MSMQVEVFCILNLHNYFNFHVCPSQFNHLHVFELIKRVYLFITALLALILSTALITLAFCARPRYQHDDVSDDVSAQTQPCFPEKEDQG